MTWPAEQVERVMVLARVGFNASEIARRTGINRSSVREWIARPPALRGTRQSACPRCDDAPLDDEAYAYLLGLYLGDGTITAQAKGVWRLRIFQTARYTRLIHECVTAMSAVLPNNVLVQPKGGCVEIGASSKHWPCLFPQAGPGRKHERPIVLVDWQQAIVDRRPQALLRGLVHSDGSRHLNRVRTRGRSYEYPRYEFSNVSSDIRRIFTEVCDRLGVHWTQMNANSISVARRADVAFLDTFIGPKS